MKTHQETTAAISRAKLVVDRARYGVQDFLKWLIGFWQRLKDENQVEERSRELRSPLVTSLKPIISDRDPQIRNDARLLWNIGVGKALGFADFESYLATIPEIPEALRGEDPKFPYLVLVDGRVSLTKLCELADVKMLVEEGCLLNCDDSHEDFSSPTWIRCQGGIKNRNKSVRTCRIEFEDSELGLTAFQGVSVVIKNYDLVVDWNDIGGRPVHVMDLPGSVYREDRHSSACLRRDAGQLELDWHYSGRSRVVHGSATRRE